MTTNQYCFMESPFGRLLITGDADGITGISFPHPGYDQPISNWQRDERLFETAVTQLSDYFAGRLHTFSLPLNPQGTPFQHRVWRALQEIPYGTTVSYRQIAERVGNANAYRAVGNANGRNPIPIVIPCHRVITADGGLGGYGSGLDIKQRLLDLERSHA